LNLQILFLKNVYKNHTVDRKLCNNIHISRKQADKGQNEMTAQLNPTADFINAKQTLLNAMRHHSIIGALVKSKVTTKIGFDPYMVQLTDEQIDLVCEAEEVVESELKYWESADAVSKAKNALIEASMLITLDLVPADHLDLVKTMYTASKKDAVLRDKLANLLIKWDVTR